MSRNKSPVFLPQPATSVLRRSARLISLRNRYGQGKFGKDLNFGSEPLRKAKKSPGSNKSTDGSSTLRRSCRVSKRRFCNEKSPPCCSTKPVSTPSFRTNSVSCCFTLRRSPRFSSGVGGGGGSLYRLQSGNSVLSRCNTKSCGGDGVRSRDTIRSCPRPKTKQTFIDCDDDEEDSVCLSEEKGNGVRPRDRSRSRPRPKTKQTFIDCDEDEEVSGCVGEGKINGVRSKDTSRSRPRPKTKQIFRECDDDDDDDEEVSLCLNECKRMRLAKENDAPKADKGKRIGKEEDGLKTKNERGWTEELELALQKAYLTVKPSPNFWKKVSKMVPGKSAQECFDRVNADLITPRQPQPRSRARKSNLSPIPQFSLSASKPLKPISSKTKIRQRKGHLSKKAIRHLLEKQNHIDQGLGFDLFSVLEPGATSSFLSTPTNKGQSLPRILESPMRGVSKDQTDLVSPPVLKQVKNKALHEKYIDHLHMREAKRKAEYNRLVGKENIRPIDKQKNDLVRAAKNALLYGVQDAVQKLKSLETENSSSSSEFCYGLGETDEEDESI